MATKKQSVMAVSMLDKQLVQPAAAGTAGEVGAAAAPDGPTVDPAEALRRFAPFVFTLETATRDTTELKGVVTAMARDATIGPNLFVVEKAETLQWFAANAAGDAAVAPLFADVKAQLATLCDAPGADASTIAAVIAYRITTFAVVRERARLEEEEAARAAHEDLVERLMDDGLTRGEAERAAAEEEEHATMVEDGLENVDTRPMAFVLLRGFPITPEHVMALHRAGVHLNAMLSLNSRCRFGRREEPAPADPKAAKGGKGTAAAKPEPKKAADTKKKGGKDDPATAAPTEPLLALMRREVAKIHKFDKHPFAEIASWTYDVPCEVTEPSAAAATSAAAAPQTNVAAAAAPAADDAASQWSPLESEGDVTEKVLVRVAALEAALARYTEWAAAKRVAVVPRLDVGGGGAGVSGAAEDGGDRQDGGAPAADGKASAAAAAAAATGSVAAAGKATGGGKSGGGGGKGGGGGGGKGGAAEAEQPKEELVAPPPPPPPPLPTTPAELAPPMDVYRRLIDEVSPANVDHRVLMHCVLEQVQLNKSSAADGAAAASAVAESIAVKNRKDVADFVDYVLAQLDGTQEQTFEATRMRRLRAAQHRDEEAGAVSDAAMADSVPLCAEGSIRLLPTTSSGVDGDALLLGLPLRRIVGRLNEASRAAALAQAHVVRTDNEGMRTFEGAHRMIRQVLTEKCGLNDVDAAQLLATRTHAELLTAQRFTERCNELLLHPLPARLIRGACVDGSGVVVSMVTVPEQRRRWRVVWDALHGAVSFPQWLQWTEHVAQENLHFNPPPKDDDDDDYGNDDDDGAGQGGDDEEEEEEEMVLDEDGEPMLNDDGEVMMRKREVKPVEVLPEFVDVEKAVMDEARRRATMEHLRRRLNTSEETLLLANNHTSNIAYNEEAFLFPGDGCTIATTINRCNTRGVHCSVHAGSSGLLFGFRAALARGSAAPRGAACGDGATVSGGVYAVIGVGTEATFHLEAAAPAPVQHGPPASDAASESAATAPKGPTPKATPRAPAGGASKGGVEGKQPVAAAKAGSGATAQQQPPPPLGSPAHDAAGGADTALADAPHDAPSTEYFAPTTSITCSTAGVTVSVDAAAGCAHFRLEAPRECPVTVYNPLTRQIHRIFTSEVARTMLADGTVLSRFEDGTRMNLMPNGNTAVLHKGIWMITNSAGRRVLKLMDGTVTPTVVSLVTTNTDVDTQSRVTTREDGVVTVQYDDGRLLVQHIDGTRMWQDAARRAVEVEVDGLPLVVASTARGVGDSSSSSSSGGGGGGGGGLLGVRFPSGLHFTVRVGERVAIGHQQLAFQAVVDLRTFVLHVKPTQESEVAYAVDFAFGGLRARDATHTYEVTPFGRTRARTIAADENPEPSTPPPADPAVRRVIEVFRRPEVVDATFAAIMENTGRPIADSLHVAADAPTCEAWDMDATGLAMPPRSRQLREKERGTVSLLRQLVPPPTHTIPNIRDPHIFVLLANGMAVELCRREDLKQFVWGAAAHSDLLHSDIFREGFAQTRQLEQEVPAPAEGSASEKLGAADAAPPPATTVERRRSIADAADGFEHIVASIAAARPTQRHGIPKIILDIRSGTSSAPMTVAHFLQELRQGAANSSSQQGGGATGGGSDADPFTVVCSTRHFVVAPIMSGGGGGGGSGGDSHALCTYAAGSGIYRRAAAHLAAAIPPVIAAQLSVARTAAIVAQGRDGLQRRSLSKERSRGSRGSDTSSRLPRKKDAAAGGSGAVGASGAGGVVDPEFAAQMEAARQAELQRRKPWPTPIPDRQQRLRELCATKPNYWALFAAADPQLAEQLQQENEKLKGAAPRRRTPQLTVEEKVLQGATAPTDAPPVERAAAAAANTAATAQPNARKLRKHESPSRPAPPLPVSAASAVAAHQRFVNPGPHSATGGGGASSSSGAHFASRLHQKRVVATPAELFFGPLMQGFRYSTSFHLTNVSVAGTRFRVTPAPSDAPWLSVDAPKAPVAAGMSARIEVEVAGTQPLGELTAQLIVASEGGSFTVPVYLTTRGAADAPVSFQPPHVRLIGPSPLPYVPGRIRVYPQPHGGGSHVDDPVTPGAQQQQQQQRTPAGDRRPHREQRPSAVDADDSD